jgi:hypothetical protein
MSLWLPDSSRVLSQWGFYKHQEATAAMFGRRSAVVGVGIGLATQRLPTDAGCRWFSASLAG